MGHYLSELHVPQAIIDLFKREKIHFSDNSDNQIFGFLPKSLWFGALGGGRCVWSKTFSTKGKK